MMEIRLSDYLVQSLISQAESHFRFRKNRENSA